MPSTALPVAVVVPVWNRAGLVVRCLDSIRTQTHAPARIVVVDDGSTDGTADAVTAWIREHGSASGATLLRQPNSGAAAARNAGLEAIGGAPLVAFLDSDDTWPADFLTRATAALGHRPDAVAASADRLRHDLSDASRTRDDLAAFARDPVKWIFRHGAGIGSGTLFRAAAVRAVGAYPEDIVTGHDSVLFCRVAALGSWLHCPGEPVTYLRHHARTTGEADHLCKRYPDHALTWAQVYETLANEPGAARLPASFRRRTLARRWVHAGVALTRLGRIRDARACFVRALHLRPLCGDAWAGLLRTSFVARATA